MPKWDGHIFAADHTRAGLVRAQSGEFVAATDPAFDTYLAMTYSDFRSMYATYVLGCKQWRKGTQMMNANEALERFSIGMKDLNDASKAELEQEAKDKETTE